MRVAIFLFLITLIGCQTVEKPLSVYAFLSSECPLSIEQTRTLNLLHQQYSPVVTFKAVFPNESDRDSVIQFFSQKYQLKMDVIRDQEHRLKDSLNATVTPQFFLLDGNGRILYSGQCDNRMISLGKKRKVVTEHYLEEAIHAALSSSWMTFSSTEPVGCTIFKSETICSSK